MSTILKSSTFKNLSKLVSGTVVAQVIPVASMPLLTRIFDPQDFGAFSLFVGISSIIIVAASLRFELAIPQAKEVLIAERIFVLCILIVLVLSCVLYLSFTFAEHQLFSILNLNREVAPNFFNFLVPTFLCSGIMQICIARSIRLSDFSGVAMGKIVVSTGYIVCQLLFGILLVPGALLFGYASGQLLGCIYLLLRSSEWLKSFGRKASFVGIRNSAIEYKNLPIYSAPGAMIDAFCSTLPLLVVSSVYGLTTAGMFGMAFRILGIPASMFSLSLSQIIFQKVASNDGLKPRYISSLLTKSILGLALIIIPFGVLMFFYGPDLFSLALGDEWRLSGEYASILIIGIGAQFLASPNSQILALKENIKLGTFWQILRLSTLFLVLFLAFEYDFETFLWLFVAHEVVIYTVYIALLYVGAKRRAVVG